MLICSWKIRNWQSTQQKVEEAKVLTRLRLLKVSATKLRLPARMTTYTEACQHISNSCSLRLCLNIMTTRNIHITFFLHVQHNVLSVIFIFLQKANYWVESASAQHSLVTSQGQLLDAYWRGCMVCAINWLCMGMTLHTNVIQPTDAQLIIKNVPV